MKIPHDDNIVRGVDTSAGANSVSRPELLVDGTDTAFRQMVHDVMAFASGMQQNRARLAASVGLTGQQYMMLFMIAENQEQDGFGIIQLADTLRLSGAFVTIEVNKLVDARLVRKRPNTVDRRRVLLNITGKAQELLDRVSMLQRPSNDTLFARMSSEDFATFRRIVSQLLESSEHSLRLTDFLATERRRHGGFRETAAP